MIGTRIDGRYEITGMLGEGGTGAVYRARHLGFDREVAVKVLRPEYGASPELRARFEREARALSALSHPNIVSILDSGVSEGQPYVVMELLRGQGLAELLRHGRLSQEEALAILFELVDALGFVHERGLVHRDVKPGNIFLRNPPDGGRVKLLDFGLAKFTAPEARDAAETRSGQLFGTPAYMAPEQVAGQGADARADVYAVGIVAFEMLTGQAPFRGDASEIMRQQVVEELPSTELPAEVPEALRKWIRKATAKGKEDRFSDAAAMKVALKAAVGLGPALELTPSGAPARSAGGRRGVARIGMALSVLVSIGALAATGLAALAFLGPAGPKGKHAVEKWLGPVATVDPFAEGPEPPLPPKPAHSTIQVVTPAEPAPSAAPAESTTPESVPSVALPSSAEPAPSAPPPPAAPRTPPKDPWASAPAEIGKFSMKVNKGRFLDKREIALVHLYNAKHPDDPRGHLVLARSHLRHKWLKDSVAEFRAAFEASPDALGDQRMLPDLLALAALGSPDAGKLAKEAFPLDVLAALDRELAKKTMRPDYRARLTRLRTEIGTE